MNNLSSEVFRMRLREDLEGFFDLGVKKTGGVVLEGGLENFWKEFSGNSPLDRVGILEVGEKVLERGRDCLESVGSDFS